MVLVNPDLRIIFVTVSKVAAWRWQSRVRSILHAYLLGQHMDADLYVQGCQACTLFFPLPDSESLSSDHRPFLWVTRASAHGQSGMKIFVCCALDIFDCVRIGLDDLEWCGFWICAWKGKHWVASVCLDRRIGKVDRCLTGRSSSMTLLFYRSYS